MNNDTLSPEGQDVMRALENHHAHMLTHQCEPCMEGYELILKAFTAWINSKEVEHGKEKELVGNSGEGISKSTKEGPQGQERSEGQGKKNPLDIFKDIFK